MYPVFALWCAVALTASMLFRFIEYHATLVKGGNGEEFKKLFSPTAYDVFLTATFWTLFYVYK